MIVPLALATAEPCGGLLTATTDKAPPSMSASFASTETATAAAKCEHGVDQALCTRCDPRLEAVFKAKGDWCPEHSRPESQCALCHPELAAAGVK